MSIKKQTLKSKPVCKVTFRIPKELAIDAEKACIVSEFNDWTHDVTPMKKLKNGEFTCTVDLTKDKDYQFKYLLDQVTWINDPEADQLVENEFGEQNSVVCTV